MLSVSTASAQRGQRSERGRGRRAFGFRGGSALGPITLLRQAAVQDHLELTSKQREQIGPLGESLREEMFGLFRELRDLPEEQRAAKTSELTASVKSKVEALLTPDQTKRLTQLELQREGPVAFSRDAIAGQLNLTPEQRDSIRAVREEVSQRGRGDRNASREERRQAREAAGRERDRKLLAILSEDQRTRWTSLLGEPFNDFERNAFGGGSRRGGGRSFGRAQERAASRPETEAEQAPGSAVASEAAETTAGEQTTQPAEASGETPARIAQSSREEQRLRFNFRFAPWDEVLQWFADEAGLSLMMDLPPAGTFNYYDNRSYSPTEALNLLNGVLLTKNFTLLRRDNLLAVVRLDQAIPPNLVPRITLEEIDLRAENELVSVVLQLRHVEVKQLALELQPLLGPQGKIVPLTAANQIVVTDTVSNLRELRDLIGRFDTSEEMTNSTLRIFPIRFADPTQVEQIIRTMLRASSSGTEENRGRRRSSQTTADVSVAVDLRTRTLLVRAQPSQLALVEQVLRTIDVAEGGAFGGGSGLPPQLEVYSLRRSDANAILGVLQTVLAGQTDVRLAADATQRSVIVLAPPDRQQIVRALVDQMDGAAARVEVIPLRRLDAHTAATAVRSLFAMSPEGEGPPALAKVQPAPDGRSLMVRGTDVEIAQMKALLASLGETPAATAGSDSPVRVIPLEGGTTRQMIETVREIWPAIRKNPIRVVGPSGEPSALRQAPRETAPEADFETDLAELLDALDDPRERISEEDVEEGAFSDDEGRVGSGEAAHEEAAAAPIIITTGAGSLVIASEDTDALNTLEELIRTLNQQRGAASNYHVFFLKAADAEQVAETLNQILGSSTTVLAGSSTITRRIVADVRTNSLLVEAGPADLDRIETLLDTLDSEELPETGVARQTRIVPLRYARASAVAGVLRDVYRDLLGTAGGQGQSSERGDSMQALFARFRSRRGGGPSSESSGGRSRQTAAARMTLGVDEAANLLVIAAPQTLFEEVEAVIQALDEAARQTRRSVHVIPITGGNSSAVQSALGALVGSNVKPAGSQQGRSTPGGRSNRNAASSGGSTGDGGTSEFRQMLMQRMFERGGSRRRGSGSDAARQRRGGAETSGQRRGGGRGN